MKNRLSLLTVFLFLITAGNISAQATKTPSGQNPVFDPDLKMAQLSVDNLSHSGYSTGFEFTATNVEKGWWKYLSSVARVKNRKTYWILTVPPKKGESNQAVVMYSSIKAIGKASTLTLALDASQMDSKVKKDYLDQTKKFVAEFKAKLYGDHIQDRIRASEKEARVVSRQQQKLMKKVLKRRRSLAKEKKKEAVLSDSSEESTPAPASELAKMEAEVARKGGELDRVKAEIELLKQTLLNYIEKAER